MEGLRLPCSLTDMSVFNMITIGVQVRVSIAIFRAILYCFHHEDYYHLSFVYCFETLSTQLNMRNVETYPHLL